MEPLAVAALVAVLVCLASVFAVEWTLSVAIVEIIAGVLAGNLFGIRALRGWISSPSSAASC